MRAAALSHVDGSVEHHNGHAVRAIRTKHKLIESSIDNTEMLFDLTADRAERTDRRQQDPELARALRTLASEEAANPPSPLRRRSPIRYHARAPASARLRAVAPAGTAGGSPAT